MTLRAAIYTRVSSEDQLNGHSLEAQARLVANYCALREWEVVKVYEERGRSGKNIFRPEFQAMLLDAEDRKFDILVVHKLDRFSRSIIDTHTYIKKLDSMGIAFTSATEPFDLTSPMGKAFLGILAIFAELYLDNLAAEISKGKKERALKGYWNGTLSWGYTTPKKLKELVLALGQSFKNGALDEAEYSRQADLIDNALELAVAKTETAAVRDPLNAPGVLLAYTEYSSGGYSDRDIAHILNEAGYRISARFGATHFRKDTVEDILQNRFYLGETSYGRKVKGQQRQWMPGNHEPLIDRALFDQCQEVRAGRARRYNMGPIQNKAFFPLSVLVYCAVCGTRWKGQKHRGIRYYRDPAAEKEVPCESSVKSVNADWLERFIGDWLRGIKLPKDWRKQIQGLAREEDDGQANERAAIEKKLERLHRLYIEGVIPDGDYQQMRNEYQQQLAPFAPKPDRDVLQLEHIGDVLLNMGKLWDAASPEDRRHLAQMIFTRIFVRNGAVEAVEPTPILWALLQVVLPDTGRTGFEPAVRSYPRTTA